MGEESPPPRPEWGQRGREGDSCCRPGKAPARHTRVPMALRGQRDCYFFRFLSPESSLCGQSVLGGQVALQPPK